MTLDHESDDIWKLAEAKHCKKQFYFQNTIGIPPYYCNFWFTKDSLVSNVTLEPFSRNDTQDKMLLRDSDILCINIIHIPLHFYYSFSFFHDLLPILLIIESRKPL